jgi:hypothetical protein
MPQAESVVFAAPQRRHSQCPQGSGAAHIFTFPEVR